MTDRIKRVVVLALLGVLLGCGEVVFVDPNAELAARLRFGLVERLVVDDDPRAYFHVRIASRDGLDAIELEVGSADGRFSLPMARATAQPCGETETCLSFTLGPGLPESVDAIVLRAPAIGHETSARVVTTRLSRHEVFAAATDENGAIEVTLVDPIRSHYTKAERVKAGGDIGETSTLLFPRAFQVLLRPGACGDGIPPRSETWIPLPGSPSTIQAAPFEEGALDACVAVRPGLPEDGPPVGSTTVRARAVVTRFRHVYTPPVERSPLVYMPLFDLEMSSEARCAEAQGLIQEAIAEVAFAIVGEEERAAEVLALPAVQIAQSGGALCRQRNDRGFDAAAVAADARRAIDDAFGTGRRVRTVLVYANNLDLPVPLGVIDAMTRLREALRDRPGRDDFVIAIAPEGASSGLDVDRNAPWIATEEPSFRASVQAELQPVWPFRTAIHTPETLVPLLDRSERGRYASFRVCSSSHEISVEGDPIAGTQVRRIGEHGPGYRAMLSEQVLVESLSFTPVSVVVDWEACEDLCDQPAPRGDEGLTWQLQEDCS